MIQKIHTFYFYISCDSHIDSYFQNTGVSKTRGINHKSISFLKKQTGGNIRWDILEVLIKGTDLNIL